MSRFRKWNSLGFWLLAVAWGCASTPTSITVVVLAWLLDARTFTHQERLAAGVAEIITGTRTAGLFAKVQAATDHSPKPVHVLVAGLKKVELAVESVSERLERSLDTHRGKQESWTTPDGRPVPPPRKPPRWAHGV